MIRNLVLTGILAAIVVVLQIFSGYIRFGPFSITLALVPIIVGAALCGPLSGAFLGLVFGTVVLINDAGAFLAINVFGTVATVLLKGMLAGLASGLIFKAFKSAAAEDLDKHPWLKMARIFFSGFACPVVNTGVFVIGCYLFFMPTIEEWAKGLGYANASTYLFIGMIGTNFIIELATVTLLSPVIARIIDLAAPGAIHKARAE